MKRLKKIICLTAALSMLITVSLSSASLALDAIPSAPDLTVNGESVYVSSYNIDGYNYFKIRDLAQILSGTEKSFSVSWDDESSRIDLAAGESYVPVGGECEESAALPEQILPSEARLYMDGAYVFASAYNIDGYNYFKLRDIMSLLNVEVEWDPDARRVSLDTGRGYVYEDAPALSSEAVACKASSVVELISYDEVDVAVGQASGFFVSQDGLVMTCAHVLTEAYAVLVRCDDGREYSASAIYAYFPESDLALLKVDLGGDSAEPAVLGDSDSLVRGQRVMVISSPGSERNTVADGLVSAFRPGGVLRETAECDIQISAPIYKGSSGGPVFDMQGRVVAVIYAMHTAVPLAGYVIPINEFKTILAYADGSEALELRQPPAEDFANYESEAEPEGSPETEPEPAPETPPESSPEPSSYKNP